jgi:hypothetical protein
MRFVGDWLFESCARSLVVGHYQPLADNFGIAPKPDQTCSLQSDQRTLANAGIDRRAFAGALLYSKFKPERGRVSLGLAGGWA